jgi:hypothetical protein
MKSSVAAFCLLTAGLACGEEAVKNSSPEPVKGTSFEQVDSVSVIEMNDTVPRNIQVDSIIYLAFAGDSSSVTVKGFLDKKGDPVICLLPVTTGRVLTASVIPEKPKANVRFSLIQLPNGKTDGPFSPTLKYKLVQKGLYKLYVAPNKMAGDPMSTDFTLTVKVQ